VVRLRGNGQGDSRIVIDSSRVRQKGGALSDEPGRAFSVQCTSLANLARIQQNRAYNMSGQTADEIRAMREEAEENGTREVSVFGGRHRWRAAIRRADTADLTIGGAWPTIGRHSAPRRGGSRRVWATSAAGRVGTRR